MEIIYEILNTSILKNIEEYEAILYQAFKNTDIETLGHIWEFDHQKQRLRAKIPYESQKIFVARCEKKIVSGVAINTNIDKPFQLEMMNFKISKDVGVAEGLGVFNLPFMSGYMPVTILLKDYAFKIIEEMGIKVIYGTCSEKKLRGYKLLGWKPIDENYFKGEKKYLLKIPIGNNPQINL